MQIFAILFSFVFLITFFLFIRKSVVEAELNKNIVKVKNSLNEDQEQIRAWAYMGMDEAVEQTLKEIKDRYKFEDLKIGPREELSKLVGANGFVLPENTDHILGEDLVLFVELKKANDSVWDHFDQYSFWFLFILALAFTLILLFSAEYIRRNIFFPFRDLVGQLEEIDSSKNSYLSAIPAKGEVGVFIDKVTQIYNSSKIKEKEEARFKLAKQVAHDIKSPLLALDVAMENIGSVDDTSRLLINDAITRIKDIANNLLSVKGERRSKSDILLLEVELERAISEKRILFKDKNSIQFKLEFDIGLDEVVFIEMNASKLQRSLSNLINNAVEAMDRSGEIRLYFSLLDPNWIRLKISDEGSGIPQSKLKLIQHQGYSFNKKGGHGLGLSYAVDSFKEAGACLKIQSIEGMGTDILVDIPCAKPPSYFFKELNLQSDSQCVFVDDYENILNTWKDIIAKNYPKKILDNCIFMNDLEEFQQWLDLGLWDEKTHFFVDYHFTRDNLKGTDVIANYPIKENTVLVTSQYDNPKLLRKLKDLNIKLLPKQLLKKISCKYLTASSALNNQSFYNSVPLNWLEKLSEKKGLANCVDLENLKTLIDARLLTGKESVLEIGFGRLRVVDWMCRNYSNPIHGIDFSVSHYERAKLEYLDSHQVQFHLGDIVEYDFGENRFDLVFWVWSGLFELDAIAKREAFKNLKKFMKNNSVLILDLALDIVGSEVKFQSKNKVRQVSGNHFCSNEIISTAEVYKLLSGLGFQVDKKIEYKTETGLKRVSVIFNYMKFAEEENDREEDLPTSIC